MTDVSPGSWATRQSFGDQPSGGFRTWDWLGFNPQLDRSAIWCWVGIPNWQICHPPMGSEPLAECIQNIQMKKRWDIIERCFGVLTKCKMHWTLTTSLIPYPNVTRTKLLTTHKKKAQRGNFWKMLAFARTKFYFFLVRYWFFQTNCLTIFFQPLKVSGQEIPPRLNHWQDWTPLEIAHEDAAAAVRCCPFWAPHVLSDTRQVGWRDGWTICFLFEMVPFQWRTAKLLGCMYIYIYILMCIFEYTYL